MRKAFLFLFCGIVLSSEAQVTFQKTCEGIYKIKKTNDGGFIAFGVIATSADTIGDIYLVKLNSSYDTLWTSLSGRQGVDAPITLVQNSDSSYFIGGSYCCSVNYYDFILHKYDKSGNLLWIKNYGNPTMEDFYDMTPSLSGGVIMVGSTVSTKSFVINVDSAGNIIWTRKFDYGPNNSSHGVKKTSDNNYILVGSNGAGYNIYLLKLNPSGNIIWSKILDSSTPLWAWSIDVTSDGGFIIGAYADRLSALDKDLLIIKTDSTGTVEWSKEYGGNSEDALPNIIQTSDGGYLATASSYSFWYQNGTQDGYAVKLNSTGDTLWTKVYGDMNHNSLREPVETSDKGFLFICSVNPGPALIKTDSMGTSGCRENMTTTHIIDFPLTEYVQIPVMDSGGIAGIDSFHVVNYQGSYSNYCFYQFTADNSLVQKSFSLFPNPATNELRITNSELKIKEIEIYNILGEKLISSQQFIIDVSQLNAGIYFVKVKTENGTAAARFVKQ